MAMDSNSLDKYFNFRKVINIMDNFKIHYYLNFINLTKYCSEGNFTLVNYPNKRYFPNIIHFHTNCYYNLLLLDPSHTTFTFC